MLPSFAQHTVQVLTAQETGDHGRAVEDWSLEPTSRTVTGCSFQPAVGQSDDENRTGSQLTAALFMPSGDPITARNRVRFGGDDYEIVGEPERWDYVDHVLVRLERWEG